MQEKRTKLPIFNGLQKNAMRVFLLAALFFISDNIFWAQTNKIKTIVIDAGHGGHDPGAIGLRGGYGPGTLDRGLEKLRAWLAMHPEWTATAAPRTLGYNSPFVPNILKYSEVQIPIAPKAALGRPQRDQ